LFTPHLVFFGAFSFTYQPTNIMLRSTLARSIRRFALRVPANKAPSRSLSLPTRNASATNATSSTPSTKNKAFHPHHQHHVTTTRDALIKKRAETTPEDWQRVISGLRSAHNSNLEKITAIIGRDPQKPDVDGRLFYTSREGANVMERRVDAGIVLHLIYHPALRFHEITFKIEFRGFELMTGCAVREARYGVDGTKTSGPPEDYHWRIKDYVAFKAEDDVLATESTTARLDSARNAPLTTPLGESVADTISIFAILQLVEKELHRDIHLEIADRVELTQWFLEAQRWKNILHA